MKLTKEIVIASIFVAALMTFALLSINKATTEDKTTLEARAKPHYTAYPTDNGYLIVQANGDTIDSVDFGIIRERLREKGYTLGNCLVLNRDPVTGQIKEIWIEIPDKHPMELSRIGLWLDKAPE